MTMVFLRQYIVAFGVINRWQSEPTIFPTHLEDWGSIYSLDNEDNFPALLAETGPSAAREWIDW